MQVRIGDLVSFDASPVAMVAETALPGSRSTIAPAWPRWLSVLRSLPLFATGLIFISWPVFRKRFGLRGAITAAYGFGYRTWRWPSMLLTERLPG